MIIHLGETVPEATDQFVYHISAGTLVLWTISVFCLMLLTFGIGAASGAGDLVEGLTGEPRFSQGCKINLVHVMVVPRSCRLDLVPCPDREWQTHSTPGSERIHAE